MKILKENTILSALKESEISADGLTLKEATEKIYNGSIDVDVSDTEIDMSVAFCYDVNDDGGEYPEMARFLNILAERTKIVKTVTSKWGDTLVCDFSSVFKPYNEELKEVFDMDNSEFDSDEAWAEAVVNLEPLISGNAGESTYKELNEILEGKNKEESVNESNDSIFTSFRPSGQSEGLLGRLWFNIGDKTETVDLFYIDGEYRLVYGMIIPGYVKEFIDSYGYDKLLQEAIAYVEKNKGMNESASLNESKAKDDMVYNEDLLQGVDIDFTCNDESYLLKAHWYDNFDFDEEVESGNIPEDANPDDWWAIYFDILDSKGEDVDGGLLVTDKETFKLDELGNDLIGLCGWTGENFKIVSERPNISKPSKKEKQKEEPKEEPENVITLNDLDNDGNNFIFRAKDNGKEIRMLVNFFVNSSGELEYTIYKDIGEGEPDDALVDGGSIEVDEGKTWGSLEDVAREIIEFQGLDYDKDILIKCDDGDGEYTMTRYGFLGQDKAFGTIKESESLKEDGPINPDDKDYHNGKLWKVGLYPGAGYELTMFKVYAGHEEEALCLVVAECERKEYFGLITSYEDLEKEYENSDEFKWFKQENPSGDFFEFLETDLNYVYVDATMEGASKPYFVHGENLVIEEISDNDDSDKGSMNESSYANNKLLDAVKDYGIVSVSLDEDKQTITFRVPRANKDKQGTTAEPGYEDGYVCATVDFIEIVEGALRDMGMDVDVFGEGESASDFGTFTLTYEPKAKGLYTESEDRVYYKNGEFIEPKWFKNKKLYNEFKEYVDSMLQGGRAIDDPEYVNSLTPEEYESLLVDTWMKDQELINMFEEHLDEEDLKEEVTFSKPESATDSTNKQSAKVRDVLDYELEDDDTETGGVSFNGETVRDFIADPDMGVKDTDSVDSLNKVLTTCGIKPISEGYAESKYRGDDYWELSDYYERGSIDKEELASRLFDLYSDYNGARGAYIEITGETDMPKVDGDTDEIKEVEAKELSDLVTKWDEDHKSIPRGRWIAKEGKKFVAIDNRTEDCWTEEFDSKEQAMSWLNDEFEMGDLNEAVAEDKNAYYYEIPISYGPGDVSNINVVVTNGKTSGYSYEEIQKALKGVTIYNNDLSGEEYMMDIKLSDGKWLEFKGKEGTDRYSQYVFTVIKSYKESEESDVHQVNYLINNGEYAISILERLVGGEADFLVKSEGKGNSAILDGYDQVEGYEFTKDDEPFYSGTSSDTEDVINLIHKFKPELEVTSIKRILDDGSIDEDDDYDE